MDYRNIKVGDTIVFIGSDGSPYTRLIMEGGRIDGWGDCPLESYFWSNSTGRKLIKIISNKSNMNLKEKFITAFLSEPEKSFRKAGITNGDGILTDEGQEVFLTYLLKKEGATFKTEVVDVLLAEEEKCSK